MVMELISRKISTKDGLMKMMYADDLAIKAESKQQLQEVFGGMEEGGVREARIMNKPGEDRSDVDWTKRGVKHQVGW